MELCSGSRSGGAAYISRGFTGLTKDKQTANCCFNQHCILFLPVSTKVRFFELTTGHWSVAWQYPSCAALKAGVR